jgi:Phage head-tail joining protein.
MYRPKKPFNVAFELLNPTYEKVQGKNIPTYPEEGERINCSFLTFGGTESVVNGVLSIKDTADIETWYRPDIKSDSHLKRIDDGKIFAVVGEPEDIEYRHQFLKFKIESLRGSRG